MTTRTKPNRKLISVPIELAERLERIAAQMQHTYETGRGCHDLTITEQGHRGAWVTPATVIARALDEYEAHKVRSNRPRSQQPQGEPKP